MKTSPRLAPAALVALSVIFTASFAAYGDEQKPIFNLDNKKVEVQADAVAKADAAASAELEKIKAELDKKFAEASKKAAAVRIKAREKMIEDLTKEKKKAMVAEKLDEALAIKAKIEEAQKEVDDLLANGSEAVESSGHGADSSIDGKCFTLLSGRDEIPGWCFQPDGVLLSPHNDSKWGSRFWGTPKYKQVGDLLLIGDDGNTGFKNPHWVFKYDKKDMAWKACDKTTKKIIPNGECFRFKKIEKK